MKLPLNYTKLTPKQKKAMYVLWMFLRITTTI